MANVPSSATLSDIFPAIVAKLQAQLNPPSNPNPPGISAFLSLKPETLDPEMADSYIAICPETLSVDQRTLTGGSNIDLYFTGQFVAVIHLRLVLDAGIRSYDVLTDRDLGIFTIIYNMISAMNMLQIIKNNNILTPVPIRLLSISDWAKEKGQDVGWTSIRTNWHIEFQQVVNTASIPYAPV
jgi:hypothetical protein